MPTMSVPLMTTAVEGTTPERGTTECFRSALTRESVLALESAERTEKYPGTVGEYLESMSVSVSTATMLVSDL